MKKIRRRVEKTVFDTDRERQREKQSNGLTIPSRQLVLSAGELDSHTHTHTHTHILHTERDFMGDYSQK